MQSSLLTSLLSPRTYTIPYMHICKYGVLSLTGVTSVCHTAIWGPHTFPWQGCGPGRVFKAPVFPDLPFLVTNSDAGGHSPRAFHSVQGPGKGGVRNLLTTIG